MPVAFPPALLEPSEPIREAVSWATVTVFTWITVLSLALILLRVAQTGRDPRDHDDTSERDAPIPEHVEPEDHQSAP